MKSLMDKHKCPVASANKDAHAKFLAEFTDLMKTFETEGPTLGFVMQVQQQVVNWLVSHIRGCDTQLKKCLMAGSV